MATYNRQYRKNPVQKKKQAYSLLERVIDFSQAPITGGEIITTAWAAGDVLEAIVIQPGQTVLHVECVVLNSSSLATVKPISIGDGDNPSRWGIIDLGTPVSITRKAELGDQAGVELYSAPKHYTESDTIDVKLGAAFTNGVIKLIVHLLEEDRRDYR